MAFNYVRVNVATGASLSTAFSSILTGLPNVNHVAIQNLCSFVVCIAVAASAPTATALDQFFVPSSGYVWWDMNDKENLIGSGANCYLRTDESACVSGIVRVVFK